MAYLDEIITQINAGIKSKLTAFPTALYVGVTYPIPKKEGKTYQFFPAIINLKGDAKLITFDDIKELIIYHKISSSAYSQLKNQSYGDGYDSFQHNYEIDLIVIADRKKVNVSPDVLEAAIASNIISTLKINNVDFINIATVSANHNSKTLFSQEFQGVDYYLKPEHIFFSIRYRVEIRYQKGCISLCQCN